MKIFVIFVSCQIKTRTQFVENTEYWERLLLERLLSVRGQWGKLNLRSAQLSILPFQVTLRGRSIGCGASTLPFSPLEFVLWQHSSCSVSGSLREARYCSEITDDITVPLWEGLWHLYVEPKSYCLRRVAIDGTESVTHQQASCCWKRDAFVRRCQVVPYRCSWCATWDNFWSVVHCFDVD